MREDEPTGGVTVGERLRARREAEGLSLETVAERTRVPRRHLSAIEASDYSALPAAPYAVGFVKSYARVLGEPAEEAGRRFRVELDAAGQAQPQAPAFAPADPARVPPLRVALVALAIAILFAAAYGSWRAGLFGTDTPDVRSRLAADGSLDVPPAAPKPRATVPASPAPAAAGPVVITATGPAWIQVSDGDKHLFTGMLKAGDRYVVPADAQAPTLRTAAAQAIQVAVGPTVLPPLAPPSTLVKNVSLKGADLLGRRGASGPAPASPAT